mmetsp:Transcript_11702/g.50075  ORF Transcript_11702/g.50075 Transcript_11702/m.50075 type:complete len:660 (-) Transcript_11702:7698-9677(-)
MRRRASRARRGRRRLVVPRTDVARAPQRGVHRELVDVPLVIQTPVRTRASANHERRVVHAAERGDNVASFARPSPSREVAVDVKQNLVRVVRRVNHDGDVVPHAPGDADVGRERFRARRRRHVVVAPKADRVRDVVAAAAFSGSSGAHQEHAPTPFAEHRDRLARNAFVGLDPRGERQKIVRLQSGVPRRCRRAAAVPNVRGVVRSAPRRDFRVRAVEVHGSRPGSVVRRLSRRRRNGERDVLRGVPQHVIVRPGGDLAVADVGRDREDGAASTSLAPHHHDGAVRSGGPPASCLRFAISSTVGNEEVVGHVRPLEAAVETRAPRVHVHDAFIGRRNRQNPVAVRDSRSKILNVSLIRQVLRVKHRLHHPRRRQRRVQSSVHGHLTGVTELERAPPICSRGGDDENVVLQIDLPPETCLGMVDRRRNRAWLVKRRSLKGGRHLCGLRPSRKRVVRHFSIENVHRAGFRVSPYPSVIVIVLRVQVPLTHHSPGFVVCHNPVLVRAHHELVAVNRDATAKRRICIQGIRHEGLDQLDLRPCRRGGRVRGFARVHQHVPPVLRIGLAENHGIAVHRARPDARHVRSVALLRLGHFVAQRPRRAQVARDVTREYDGERLRVYRVKVGKSRARADDHVTVNGHIADSVGVVSAVIALKSAQNLT